MIENYIGLMNKKFRVTNTSHHEFRFHKVSHSIETNSNFLHAAFLCIMQYRTR